MTKDNFISIINELHKNNVKDVTVSSVHSITRLSMDLCDRLVDSLWICSEDNYFGNNLYQLLEVSANSDSNSQLNPFEPKLKTNTCTVYVIYPDEHAAAFALYKINKY